ncbi:glycosyltransferase family 92 protein F13G3.3-like [Gastrophryne carolinensis]
MPGTLFKCMHAPTKGLPQKHIYRDAKDVASGLATSWERAGKGFQGLTMNLRLSKFFLLSLSAVAILFCFYILSDEPDILIGTRTPVNLCNSNRLSTDTITPLEDGWTFVISPNYDGREEGKPMVRVLSIMHYREVKELYCWFCCQTNRYIQISKAKLDKHSDRFGFSYVATDLLCKEPPDCNAKYLSVHPSSSGDLSKMPLFQIRNRDTGPFTANFTVCISTMFGNFSNVLQFIQSMEMYRILGAQRVMIYLNSCSPLMEKVMQYYVRQGMLEIVPWPIERYLRPANAWHYSLDPKDIGYYGQLPTLNDCIYRNMYRSQFVLLNDIDEIILPFHHQTWDSMMEDLQRENPSVGVFLFENHIFPQTVSTKERFSGTSSWKDVPGFNILQYVHREPDRWYVFNARKLIVDPRKMIQTSVHYPLKNIGKVRKVPLKTALVYHCRGPLQHGLERSSMIEDKTIWKFSGQLIPKVNKVLSELSLP